MRARATRQIHDHARDVLGPTQAPRRVARGVLLEPARHLQQPVGHLGRKEAGADGVDEDVARAQVHREVAAQVDDGGLARAVPERRRLPQGRGAQPRGAGGDDDAARVLEGRALLQQGGKLLDAQEHALDVQVHDLLERGVRVRVEGGAPRRAGVGHQDVHVVCVLRHLGDERLDARERGAVGRHGDGASAGL